MTSSLVGSEMCIRDRHYPRANDGVETAWQQLHQYIPAYNQHYDWPKSVSYTHLTLPTICSV
eukprot:11739710-Prorocentrum_lima.AAC.1